MSRARSGRPSASWNRPRCHQQWVATTVSFAQPSAWSASQFSPASGAVGHLEDMGHGVMRARVERVERERGARARLGFLVARRSPRVRRRAWRGRRGSRAGRVDHAGSTAATRSFMHVRVAADVVERVRRLQRERVARLEAEQVAEGRPGRVEVVVVEERCDRGDMEALALVGRQRGGARERRARHRDPARVAAADEQVRLQHVRHHEAGRFLQGERQRLPRRRRASLDRRRARARMPRARPARRPRPCNRGDRGSSWRRGRRRGRRRDVEVHAEQVARIEAALRAPAGAGGCPRSSPRRARLRPRSGSSRSRCRSRAARRR